jgi:hypothetical protein
MNEAHDHFEQVDCHGRTPKDANAHTRAPKQRLEENKVFIPRARSFCIGSAKKELCRVAVTVRHVMRYTRTKFQTHDRVPRLAEPALL